MPLEVQAASYLAASDKMVSLSSSSTELTPKKNICSIITCEGKKSIEIENMFYIGRGSKKQKRKGEEM